MGRTNPTFRDLLRALADRWRPFRRALRHEDRERFDRLLADAERHADAAGHLNHDSPVVPVLVAVALAQERRIDDLRERVDGLAARVDDQPARVDDPGQASADPGRSGSDQNRSDGDPDWSGGDPDWRDGIRGGDVTDDTPTGGEG